MVLKKRRRLRWFSIIASFLMVFSLITPAMAAKTSVLNNKLNHSLRDSSELALNKMSTQLLESFNEDSMVTFLIKFKEKADTETIAAQAKQQADQTNMSGKQSIMLTRSAVVSELRATSLETQQNVTQYLEQQVQAGKAKDLTSYYIVNGMAVTATKEVAKAVATFDEVEKILPNETRQLFKTTVEEVESTQSHTSSIEWNVDRVNAPQAWEMGIDGSGTVVASIDTGVQWDHPALKSKYRGYNASTGEVNHDFNWFDATAGRSTPYDDQGHGTHVTGTMVGSEPGGNNQVGVAPGAKYIAVKAFTSQGGSDRDLLAAAQWILAPTDANGNARVDLAPDVVNNSWGGGPGLDEWYRDVVRNWRAAEIFPEFSAGNITLSNPGGPGSVAAPANYPESFATGSIDINNKVANSSLRGPSPYGLIKPDIAAPGVNIRSSVPGGGYEGGWSGTSMAGPAVSGVAAMLRQVNATMSVEDMEQILLETANPLTDSQYPTVPNHGYGHGLVDAYAAVSAIASGLGKLEGQVTRQGDDSELPTFQHTAPVETYAGMNLDLSIQVTDNVSIASVNLNYLDENDQWTMMQATQKSGDYTAGEFGVTVSGDKITGSEFIYKWTINDFGNNEVTSQEYSVAVKPGISVGYFEDFEQSPIGWTSFGNKNSWEWGIPTSGPGNAASGEKVYATNLSGNYDSSMNATLVMPPVDLPEGESYLQFKQWHNFEESPAGRAWDYGHVFISTDMEEWTQLLMIQGASGGWIDAEVDLSDYNGQRVYIGFNAFSDGSVVREGWYIDDVALSTTSQTGDVSIDPIKGKLGIMTESGLGQVKSIKKPGAVIEKGKDALETPIDPKTIKPALPKNESSTPPFAGDGNGPALLPLGAQVSILETDRSVYTNPANGKYTLTHGSGSFTAKAEAYGYQSTEQSVTINADETAIANFTLLELAQATISGTVTDQSTGDPIAGATLLLLEDANITPVETDSSGHFSLTAYEGDYTLKVIARGYNSQEAAISIGGQSTYDFALEPFFTYPGGEIGYDDGTAENARAFYDAGNGWGVKMSLPEGDTSGIVTEGIFRFWNTEWPVPGGTAFAVEVWDAKGPNGTPGQKLAGPFDAQAKRNNEWTVVNLSDHNITVDGDFYMVYIQSVGNPNAPGLATDEDGPNAKRSYQYVSGAWTPAPAEEGNYMIRARVNYEVSQPVITSPKADTITNDENAVIEGKASPTTTITLNNNGEEVDSVVVGSEGTFSFPIILNEGDNEFTAVSSLDDRVTGTSSPVKVVLDTLKPELTITNPIDGEKTNRESVTVEGTVMDANLESVTVNGQKASIAEDGTYSKRILLDPGVNEIKVIAKDLAGNKKTLKISITAQYVAPEITNLTPKQDVHLVTGKSVKFEFDSAPGLTASYIIHMPLTNVDGGNDVTNATELPMSEVSPGHYVGYWTVPLGVVADGARVEVKVTDNFGNAGRKIADGKLFINIGPNINVDEEGVTEEGAGESSEEDGDVETDEATAVE
ncbi:S8 family serine peptidase [Sporosarcina sp. Sa2YVA2]|uniref:S8 family serine peptidase n=1 Tax=Sporosarcina quadrami TaxID=2762234 RepID=A0ABR8UDM5_9BACL|nr:S8 family peptidase [Sporosarcina quadrami]MBD7985813.1 S8 family serine peptidase [Sporosarcina quadrami]